MRFVSIIILAVLFNSCYTQLHYSSNDAEILVEISDTSVFLPNQTFTTPAFPIKYLYGNWVNSREEEINIIKIYRPQDYKDFPASRFRNRFNFYENGECEYLILEPTDGQRYLKYRWRLLKENPNIIYLYDEKGWHTKFLRIEKLDADYFGMVWVY